MLAALWARVAFTQLLFILCTKQLRSLQIYRLHGQTRDVLGKYNMQGNVGIMFCTQSGKDQTEVDDAGFNAKAWVSLNTRGGVLVWSIVLGIVPLGVYSGLVSAGFEATKVGSVVGGTFVALTTVLWASSYFLRVANKDMTYAKQLRQYEDAVLQKRLDELTRAELVALTEADQGKERIP